MLRVPGARSHRRSECKGTGGGCDAPASPLPLAAPRRRCRWSLEVDALHVPRQRLCLLAIHHIHSTAHAPHHSTAHRASDDGGGTSKPQPLRQRQPFALFALHLWTLRLWMAVGRRALTAQRARRASRGGLAPPAFPCLPGRVGGDTASRPRGAAIGRPPSNRQQQHRPSWAGRALHRAPRALASICTILARAPGPPPPRPHPNPPHPNPKTRPGRRLRGGPAACLDDPAPRARPRAGVWARLQHGAACRCMTQSGVTQHCTASWMTVTVVVGRWAGGVHGGRCAGGPPKHTARRSAGFLEAWLGCRPLKAKKIDKKTAKKTATIFSLSVLTMSNRTADDVIRR
ncbi:MAG: hypothetical protein J3K34DRAFT_97 [Monoraphidium minutum]|nr:MAG: hypothetical protein J3K34DRAFT_97 [Monoraphidium minutum]